MDSESQAIALKGLTYLVPRPDLLEAFMAATGVDEQAIRGRVEDPGLLTGVLEFLLADERLLLAFCEECGLDPAAPATAHARLTGDLQPREPI